jgi:hypothetical protein
MRCIDRLNPPPGAASQIIQRCDPCPARYGHLAPSGRGLSPPQQCRPGASPDKDPETYSHSIINEPSKLLICNELEADPRNFTVIFTVKVRGTSIGAGLRAIRQNVAFRGLSTSIDSDKGCPPHQRAPVKAWEVLGKRAASNALSLCTETPFRRIFYRHGSIRAV